jgi:dihydrodipicolinate synthase/N-acetylneuraminate lyase
MRGVCPAIVTHFNSDLRVDYEAIEAEVSRLIQDGVHGIVATGTMGESGRLSSEERKAVVETSSAAAAGQVPVCAGISAATAEQASAYGRDAQSAGADELQLLPPLAYRSDRREILEFYTSVGQSTDLPLVVYNNPDASGSDLTPDVLAAITRELPSVSSIKECSGDARRIAELISLCGGIDVLVGGDDWALEGFCAGASGWIAGVAVVLPRQCVQLWDLCSAGELDEARALYAALLPLARCDMTPKLVQYFKAALDELGIGGGPCRPPRLPLNEEELSSLRDAVAQVTSAHV